MNKDRKVLVQQASDYILNKSSISHSLKYLYLEAEASLLQLLRADQRIAAVFKNVGAVKKENPDLAALKNYNTAIKQAVYFFDEFISKMIVDATWGSNDGDNRIRSYENWQSEANLFSKFSLLFFDRAYRDPEQAQQMLSFMEGLNSHGIFDERDFDYFTPKSTDK